jgi:iron complex outermembrane receptor protein
MNTMFARRSIATRLAAAASAALLTSLGTPALAQDSVERVEITGSAIKRIEAEGALPLQVFTRADIERSGATTATELIQKLPSMQGFVTTSESVGGGGAGFASASLRSLGQRTLVLLNGRRLAPWSGQTLTGYGDGIDLNTIPIAAIERIEVLTDGASALYGSDAIAGVVNFITRSNYEKFELFGGVMIPQHKGGAEQRFSATKGFGSLDKDGYNFLIAANKDHQDAIKSLDRKFANTGNIFYTQNGQRVNFGNFSTRAIPANIRSNSIPGGLGNPFFAGLGAYAGKNGTCPPQHLKEPTGAPFCYFDYVTTLEIQPEQDRQSVLLSGNWKLGNNATAYGEYVHSESEVLWKIAPPPIDMPINNTMPFWATYVAPLVGAATTAVARWRMMDASNRTTLDTTGADHLVAGMKGLTRGWDYDASLTHSRNYWKEEYVKGWLTANGVKAALAAGTLNPFLLPGGQSAAGMATVESAQYKGEFKRGSTTLQSANLRGSREAFAAPGGAAMFGTGIDVRREQADYTPSNIAMGIGNNIAGDTAAERPFDVSRNIFGMYGELQVPFQKGLEGTGSLRFDRYSDFGNATTAKVATRWTPTRQWLVRASAGTGYKAPSVPQTANVQQHYGVTGGAYACPPWIAADPTLGPLCIPGNNQYDVFAKGNPNLKPEKSTQFSIGTRFEPTAALSFGVDYWNIHLKQRIGQIDESLIFNDPQFRNLFTTFLDPVLGTNVLAILTANANMGEAKAAGLDFDIVGRARLGTGNLTSRLLWTHMLKHSLQDASNGPFHSDLGVFATGLGPSAGVVFRNVVRWFNTLEYDNWSHSLTANFKSSYVDQAYSKDNCSVVTAADLCIASYHKVKAYYTLDWQTGYKMGKSLRLTGGVINVLDQDPPLSIKNVAGHQIGYDNRYADARGRTYYLNVRYEM